MQKILWAGVVGLALMGCGGDASYEPSYGGSNRSSIISEPRATTTASPEAPRDTVIALQTCVDHYAKRLSSDSYAVLYDIEATGTGGITAVKVKDSMLAHSDLEACLSRGLERMEVPVTALNPQQGATPQSRSMVGVVQAAAAPIALLPIVLVAAGVTIVVGVTIYVASEGADINDVIDAARRRRPKPTKNRCLDAAAGGEYMWEEFCRSMKEPGNCWSKTYESEQNKRGWCNAKFGS